VSVSPETGSSGPPSGDEADAHATKAGPSQRHIRSFALRRGHVTQGQRRAFDELLPRFGLPYAETSADLVQLFGRTAPTVLEIGFGMGETTAAMAAARPDINFLGVEVFLAGVGALLKRIGELNLDNVRIIHHDAVDVVRAMISPSALAGVHIYFPDPWQKKRHHKRRLITQPFVGQLASRIAPGGYLHCATDWEDYAAQMLAELGAETQLMNAHIGYAPDGHNPLTLRPTTKFHARGDRLGHGVWDLVFRRR
jgi:tRNA (guanine-N7-)-methyltransferase